MSVIIWATQAPPLYSGVLMVETKRGYGSCFIVDQRDEWWYAITAEHVVNPGSNITVDMEMYDAEIVKVDSEEDVALIRFQSPEDYRIYSFGKLRVGRPCTTIGWSRGSQLIYKGNIVSQNFGGYIVANGGVVPGCSGGVLFNEHNDIVGVTVAYAAYRFCAFDSTALYTPARYAEALVTTIGE